MVVAAARTGAAAPADEERCRWGEKSPRSEEEGAGSCCIWAAVAHIQWCDGWAARGLTGAWAGVVAEQEEEEEEEEEELLLLLVRAAHRSAMMAGGALPGAPPPAGQPATAPRNVEERGTSSKFTSN